MAIFSGKRIANDFLHSSLCTAYVFYIAARVHRSSYPRDLSPTIPFSKFSLDFFLILKLNILYYLDVSGNNNQLLALHAAYILKKINQDFNTARCKSDRDH